MEWICGVRSQTETRLSWFHERQSLVSTIRQTEFPCPASMITKKVWIRIKRLQCFRQLQSCCQGQEFGNSFCLLVSSHLRGHAPGEEEVRQRGDEDEAGRHQEAQPPGPHPPKVIRGQLNVVWKKKKTVSELYITLKRYITTYIYMWFYLSSSTEELWWRPVSEPLKE